MTSHIRIFEGDITQARVDAIVNAANVQMLGGGGVDGAIHRAAGPDLLEACLQVTVSDGIRCPVGESRITGAGELSARFVIHTVGPRYEIDPQPRQLLANAYRNSLALALKHSCTSVAFPAISCGVYRFPLDEAAPIAIAQCCREEFAALDIQFYLFGTETYDAWQRSLEDARL